MKNVINVLAAAPLPEGGQKRIAEVSDQIKLTVSSAAKPGDIPASLWENVDVLYTWDILPEPGAAPNLKWIQFKSAGVDAHLDHPVVRSPEVIVTSMSGVITAQIAEYVLMMLLALDQNLLTIFRNQQEHHWPGHKERWYGFQPKELRHSTVGILGYGSIGRQVARLLKTFGATVLAAKKDVMHPEDRGYTQEGMGDPSGEFFDRLYPMEALNSLLKECDFIVVSLPLTDATRHILDGAAFEAMKESAYLINVGRGELIDEGALIHALKTEQIAGAALDVFEKEPLPKDSPLWEMENVIISPHISGVSRYLHEETFSLFIENLQRYSAKKPLFNQVDIRKGY